MMFITTRKRAHTNVVEYYWFAGRNWLGMTQERAEQLIAEGKATLVKGMRRPY